jgi:hypothetical protein
MKRAYSTIFALSKTVPAAHRAPIRNECRRPSIASENSAPARSHERSIDADDGPPPDARKWRRGVKKKVKRCRNPATQSAAESAVPDDTPTNNSRAARVSLSVSDPAGYPPIHESQSAERPAHSRRAHRSARRGRRPGTRAMPSGSSLIRRPREKARIGLGRWVWR